MSPLESPLCGHSILARAHFSALKQDLLAQVHYMCSRSRSRSRPRGDQESSSRHGPLLPIADNSDSLLHADNNEEDDCVPSPEDYYTLCPPDGYYTGRNEDDEDRRLRLAAPIQPVLLAVANRPPLLGKTTPMPPLQTLRGLPSMHTDIRAAYPSEYADEPSMSAPAENYCRCFINLLKREIGAVSYYIGITSYEEERLDYHRRNQDYECMFVIMRSRTAGIIKRLEEQLIRWRFDSHDFLCQNKEANTGGPLGRKLYVVIASTDNASSRLIRKRRN